MCSLRVNLDMGKSAYGWMIMKDENIPGTVVRTSTIPEELGRLVYLLTDKTGKCPNGLKRRIKGDRFESIGCAAKQCILCSFTLHQTLPYSRSVALIVTAYKTCHCQT